MDVIEVNLSDLKPYERNPRNNDDAVAAVAKSIEHFGFKVPIIIDKDNIIVAGHTRMKAAMILGLEKVPCIVADDLSEEQIKAFRLADNKVAELASWDFSELEKELDELKDMELDFDMSEFGFDSPEIGGGTEQVEDPEEEEDPFDDIEKLETHYGVPYQGNKSRIADIIIKILPAGKRLVDLFGGGGAITHCAMLSGKWESFLYNDLNDMITGLFIDAVYGKYSDEHRVITREAFEELKNTDAYVKYIWSFGNNGSGYLWGKDIEEIKCTACHSLVDDSLRDRRLAYMKFVKTLKKRLSDYRLEPIERLQSLEHLQGLQQLEALQRLEVLNISYEDYEYQEGDVVYCDIPYEQANKGKCDDYGVNFDSFKFYEWAKAQDYQIFFSSYEISDDSFFKVKVKTLQSLIGANTNGKMVNEYLYSNKPFKTA